MEFLFLAVFLCLVLSFLFSGAETALTSLGKLEIESFRAEESRRSLLIKHWTKDPNRILVTILVGNNISNIAASSLLAVWASRRHPDYASLIIFVFTIVVILFSEIIPKIFARTNSRKLAPIAVQFLLVIEFLLKPVIWLVHLFSQRVVMLSGMPGRQARAPITEEELEHTIEIATREGGIDQETGQVLSKYMDFSDKTARDIMTPRSKIQPVMVSWNQEQVLKFVAADGHSRYPVVRGSLDEIDGILLVKDFLAHLQRGAGTGTWTRVVRRSYYVAEQTPANEVMKSMKRWRTHLALVRNETGVVTGLVTFEDLLEEIVGEIADEHDDPVSDLELEMMRATGQNAMVSGEMPIIDFNERFKDTLPLSDAYSTLNGYIIERAGGVMPPAGTLLIEDGVTFKIFEVSKKGIATVEVIPQRK